MACSQWSARLSHQFCLVSSLSPVFSFPASSNNSTFITQTKKLAFLATAIKAAKTLQTSLWLPWFLSIFSWLFLRIVFPPMRQGGGEREKCLPLAHTGQISFIHLALFLIYAKINVYTFSKVVLLFPPYGLSIAHALLQNNCLQGQELIWLH